MGNMGVLMSTVGTPRQHEIILSLLNGDMKNRDDEQIGQPTMRVQHSDSCKLMHCAGAAVTAT